MGFTLACPRREFGTSREREWHTGRACKAAFMTRSGLVSVIVPAFRVESYLDDCVASILGQTYRCIEVLLIDDGSDDGSPAICDDWARRDRRVRAFHKHNGGLADARNFGIEKASGEYLTFVDGDDVLHQRALEWLVEQAARDGVQIAMAGMERFEAQAPLYRREGVPVVVGAGQAHREAATGGVNMMACAKLYRRNLFDDGLRFRPGVLFEDVEFTARAFAAADRVVDTGWLLYGYRQRPGSIMSNASQALSADLVNVLESSIDVSRERYGEEDPLFAELVVAYVTHAAHKLEHLDGQKAAHSSDFLRAYQGLVARHWGYLKRASTLSRPYRVALRISMMSPRIFVSAVSIAKQLKRTAFPFLRRSSTLRTSQR